jgi:hypothetical protein
MQSNSLIQSFMSSPKNTSISYTGNTGDRLYIMQLTSKKNNNSKILKEDLLSESNENSDFKSKRLN